ncbi:glycosyltransferase family 4 protein [Corynebacterium atrinae]|nr:glycosyltransferase family 4 protein [Corynebacterium atrinae]
MVELLRRGAKVTLIIPAGPGRLRKRLDDLDIAVLDSPFDFTFRPSRRTVRGLWQLRRLISSLKPTVIFYHLYASALAARISSVFTGVPRVHMVAGPLYLESPIISKVEGVLRRMDSVLISGSKFTFQEYEKLCGPRPSRHLTIPYGVDTSVFLPSALPKIDVRRSLGIAPEEFVAIMVAYTYAPKDILGQEVGVKGHEILLEAWSQFTSENPGPARLVIVGSGFDETEELHRQKLIAKGAEKVEWIDTVEDVQPYYHAADVSVSSSISENHGAALEAGACGCPQIVSNAGGLPETVQVTSGWVYPMTDVNLLVECLKSALEEKRNGKLEKRSLAAREFIVSRFDARECAERVADAILQH